jgi:hypothetical protein
MAITKATSSVLADNAALNNLNAGASIAFTKPVSVSGNLTVDTNTFFVDSVNNRVGIGTITPAVPLQIQPNVEGVSLRLGQDGGSGRLEFGNINVAINRASNQLALQGFNGFTFGTQNGEMMRITSSGSVGIGTTSPNEKLHIYDSVDAHLKIAGADMAGSIRKLSLERSTGGAEIHFNEDTRITQGLTLNTTNAAYPMSFQINGDTKMFVNTTGNVGIGTVAPNERLTVSGNANISGNISANNLVYNTGNQTVSGIKDFQSVPLVSGEEVYYKKNVVYFTGNNFTPDANLARTFEYVLTGLAGASATLNAPINMNNGENIVIKIKQSPSGSNNIIFDSNYKFPGGVIPSLTLTPSKADIYTALKIDSNFYSTYIKDFIN